MSVNAEKFVWRKRKLNPSMKYVMIALARHHDIRTGMCCPSMKDICADTCMSISTVRRNIEGLAQLDMIIVNRHVDAGHCFQYTFVGFNPRESKRINKPSKKTREKLEAEPEVPETAGEKWNKMFDTIWDLYPRKVSKANAQRAFSKLIPTEKTYVEICNNIRDRVIGEWSDKEAKYIPHLATYLNGKRWEDELEDDGKVSLEGDNEYLKGL